MKIARVAAIPLRIPVNFEELGIDHPGHNTSRMSRLKPIPVSLATE